jgi:hypothetical protein
MATRNYVDIGTQLAAEVTPGTFVGANRILPTINFDWKPQRQTQRFRAQRSKYDTSMRPGKLWSIAPFNGILDFASIVYPLAGLLPYAAPVQIGVSGCYTWTFLPNSRGADARKTFSFEYGDDVNVDRYAFGQFASLDIDLTQDGGVIAGNAFARKAVFNQALTAAATKLAERPVDRSMVNVYLDTAFANIGTTQLTDADSEKLSLGEKFKPRWVHDRTLGGNFKDVAEVAPPLTFDLVMEHNAQSRGYLVSMDANDLVYARIDIQGEQIGTSGGPVYESIQIDIAGKFDQPEPIGDNEGSWAYRHKFCALDDPAGLGRPFKVTVVNSLAGL